MSALEPFDDHKSFFDTLQGAFDFLTDHHGFTAMAGFAVIRKGRLVIHPPSTRGEALRECNDCTVRYEGAHHTIEFLYNLTQQRIDCFITYSSMHRFALTNLMQTIKPDTDINAYNAIQHKRLDTQVKMDAAITALRNTLKPDIDLYLGIDSDTIDAAYIMQSDLLPQNINQSIAAQDMKTARIKAKAELEKHNYKAAIMLLRPFKDQLPPEDFEILSLALTKLGE